MTGHVPAAGRRLGGERAADRDPAWVEKGNDGKLSRGKMQQIRRESPRLFGCGREAASTAGAAERGGRAGATTPSQRRAAAAAGCRSAAGWGLRAAGGAPRQERSRDERQSPWCGRQFHGRTELPLWVSRQQEAPPRMAAWIKVRPCSNAPWRTADSEAKFKSSHTSPRAGRRLKQEPSGEQSRRRRMPPQPRGQWDAVE